MKSVHRFVWS
jgi:hypothetical protein